MAWAQGIEPQRRIMRKANTVSTALRNLTRSFHVTLEVLLVGGHSKASNLCVYVCHCVCLCVCFCVCLCVSVCVLLNSLYTLNTNPPQRDFVNYVPTLHTPPPWRSLLLQYRCYQLCCSLTCWSFFLYVLQKMHKYYMSAKNKTISCLPQFLTVPYWKSAGCY